MFGRRQFVVRVGRRRLSRSSPLRLIGGNEWARCDGLQPPLSAEARIDGHQAPQPFKKQTGGHDEQAYYSLGRQEWPPTRETWMLTTCHRRSGFEPRRQFYFTSLMHVTAGNPLTWLTDRFA